MAPLKKGASLDEDYRTLDPRRCGVLCRNHNSDVTKLPKFPIWVLWNCGKCRYETHIVAFLGKDWHKRAKKSGGATIQRCVFACARTRPSTTYLAHPANRRGLAICAKYFHTAGQRPPESAGSRPCNWLRDFYIVHMALDCRVYSQYPSGYGIERVPKSRSLKIKRCP